jgi:hypothetical protein
VCSFPTTVNNLPWAADSYTAAQNSRLLPHPKIQHCHQKRRQRDARYIIFTRTSWSTFLKPVFSAFSFHDRWPRDYFHPWRFSAKVYWHFCMPLRVKCTDKLKWISRLNFPLHNHRNERTFRIPSNRLHEAALFLCVCVCVWVQKLLKSKDQAQFQQHINNNKIHKTEPSRKGTRPSWEGNSCSARHEIPHL